MHAVAVMFLVCSFAIVFLYKNSIYEKVDSVRLKINIGSYISIFLIFTMILILFFGKYFGIKVTTNNFRFTLYDFGTVFNDLLVFIFIVFFILLNFLVKVKKEDE